MIWYVLSFGAAAIFVVSMIQTVPSRPESVAVKSAHDGRSERE